MNKLNSDDKMREWFVSAQQKEDSYSISITAFDHCSLLIALALTNLLSVKALLHVNSVVNEITIQSAIVTDQIKQNPKEC